MKNIGYCTLTTPFEESADHTWEEYPRPQLRRDSYISLCGEWKLSVESEGTEKNIGSVQVPFPPESRLSGVERPFARNERYIYRRSFALPEGFNRGKVLLHFGAVDQIAGVWINDVMVGEHKGGYLPFSINITKRLKQGENAIKVEVTDALDKTYAYGKQRVKRGGMWYTPISGIWQPVWIESVPKEYIYGMRITPSLDSILIETEGGVQEKTLRINTPNGEIVHSYSGDSTTIEIPDPIHWTPDEPHLYDFTLSCGEDEISSYFALRTVTIEKVNGQAYICLNGEPYFFHGLLDQGYYSDGIYLPATPEGYEWDIKTMKKLGFNMLRKHIKIEPDLFYYYCDKYGMIVFQDMVNSGGYNFLVDTALPTIGMKRGITHHAGKRRRQQFLHECAETVRLLYNHPSVCYYTIFNEGWGQFDSNKISEMIQQMDPTRTIDRTSGWHDQGGGDFISLHTYFTPIKVPKDPRCYLLSEFGGYSYRPEGHVYNLKKAYGYRFFEDREKFEKELLELYELVMD